MADANVSFSVRDGANLEFLIICDHASNKLPACYDNLGLSEATLKRHIAYDLGASAVACALAHELDCPLVMAQFSRLLIDPNRGIDDPTLVVRYSDGEIIPANHDVSPHRNRVEWQYRIDHFYAPYSRAIARARAHASAHNITPMILSIHSFTEKWRGTPRPWQAAVLWDKDPRLAQYILKYMAKNHPDICFGDNQPYSGRLKNDCLYRHATAYGLPHALIELRQDIIANKRAQNLWALRLADIMCNGRRQKNMTDVKHYGSTCD